MSADRIAWTCPNCGNEYQLKADAKAPDMCPTCAGRFTIKRRVTREEAISKHGTWKEPAKADDEEIARSAARIKLSTLPAINGFEVQRQLGIVGAECVFGISSWKEFWAGGADFWGTRSKGLESEMTKLRETAFLELRKNALAIGADAVVDVQLHFSEIGTGQGMSMMLLSATGTAIRFEKAEDD